jgi:glycerophosphoryl diester phosphodiesterase
MMVGMPVFTPLVTSPTTGYPYLDEPGTVLALAHRGGAQAPGVDGLENSLRAFRHAVELGYRYLETDVHATRDGVLVAFHDAVLDRVTDGTGAISSLTHDVVRRARIGGVEPITTLAELFDAFPKARFNIDIKAENAVRPLADFIDARSAYDRVLVGSFSPSRLNAFRRLVGDSVPTSAHPLEVAVHLLLPVELARRFSRAKALQIPHRHKGLLIASKRLIRKAHRAGLHVHVWTVDDPEEMRELLDLGVDGLVTDRTDVLREVFVERGLWQEATP